MTSGFEVERRLHPRVPFAKAVELRLGGASDAPAHPYRMDLINLSRGGLRCLGEAPWVEQGTPARVAIDGAGRRGRGSFNLRASVTRVSGAENTSGITREMALEFGETPEIQKLRGYLERAQRAHERFDAVQGHRSALADSLRMVSAGLGPATSDRPGLVLVTSALSGEGKSFTAAHLASALGAEERVLLVDADLRQPSLRANAAGAETGLVQWLGGGGNSNLMDAKRETRGGLALIPAGDTTNLAHEVWTPGAAALLVESLRSSGYTRVVLDAPPVLTCAETSLLAAAVDHVLLVVRAGVTGERSVKQAKSILQRCGAQLSGIILNDPQSGTQPEYLTSSR